MALCCSESYIVLCLIVSSFVSFVASAAEIQSILVHHGTDPFLTRGKSERKMIMKRFLFYILQTVSRYIARWRSVRRRSSMLQKLRDRRLQMERSNSPSPRLRWPTSAPDTVSTSRGSYLVQSWLRWPGESADITVRLSKITNLT